MAISVSHQSNNIKVNTSINNLITNSQQPTNLSISETNNQTINITNDAHILTASSQASLPNVKNAGNNRVLTSDGSSFGIYANNDLVFDNNTLKIGSALGTLGVSYINSISSSYPDLTISATGIYLYGDVYANDGLVSVMGHTHDSSNITDFNTAVSGLLPTNLNKRIAKAWINFNGTGAISIRSQYNISALIDNGVGDYTIVFSVPMSSTDYCFVTWCRDHNSDNVIFNNLGARPSTTKSTSSLRLIFNNPNSVLNFDSPECNIIVFGD